MVVESYSLMVIQANSVFQFYWLKSTAAHCFAMSEDWECSAVLCYLVFLEKYRWRKAFCFYFCFYLDKYHSKAPVLMRRDKNEIVFSLSPHSSERLMFWSVVIFFISSRSGLVCCPVQGMSHYYNLQSDVKFVHFHFQFPFTAHDTVNTKQFYFV